MRVVAGVVTENRIMDGMGDIGDSPDGHNAPYKDPVQSTWEFYEQLLEDINP